MALIKIVTDGSADIPPELARELGIEVVPLLLHVDEKIYRAGIDLSDDQAYELIASGPGRLQAGSSSSAVFEHVYRRLIGTYDYVFSIHLARAWVVYMPKRRRRWLACRLQPRSWNWWTVSRLRWVPAR